MSEAEAEGMAVSMWALAASWFTPTVLFCVMNLVIGSIFIASNLKTREGQGQGQGQGEQPRVVPTTSLLERVRSFDFRIHRSDPQTLYQDQSPDPGPDPLPPDSGPADHQQTLDQAHPMARRSKSEVAHQTPAKVRKSASEKAVDEEVDAKADDFINRFRQQLKLQRLDSLLRYKEMFSRGSSN